MVPESGAGAWLDLCCGSGVQGLAAVAWGRCGHATCVDINPRAVHFTLCNALLNGVPIHGDHPQLQAFLGDLYEPVDLSATRKRRFDAVLANPPFIAIPSSLTTELDKSLHLSWALFAAGGPAGNEVLRRIMEGAADHLEPGGWLGIVTEIPNVRATGTWLAPLLGRHDGPIVGGHESGGAEETEGPGEGWVAAVLFGPNDVVCAADYAAARAAERGWRGGGEAVVSWERGMRESSVDNMTSALIYGCHCGDAVHKEADRGSSGGSRFDLREYDGEEPDFMLGGGAEFVEAALEATGRSVVSSGQPEQ